MTPREVIEDLEWRYGRAITALTILQEDATMDHETRRLGGKIEGVELALSYLRDYKPHFLEGE